MATKLSTKAKTPKKTHAELPMTKKANRIELLDRVIGKKSSKAELKIVVTVDGLKRPYRKPVVVEDVRFPSVTKAAEWLAERWFGKNVVSNTAFRAQVVRNQQNIQHWCNADNKPGYYWAE